MIANIDENLAMLEKMLVDEGLRDNTILIFMTDNGGTGGVHVFNAGMRGEEDRPVGPAAIVCRSSSVGHRAR